jgi:hypothetical protein
VGSPVIVYLLCVLPTYVIYDLFMKCWGRGVQYVVRNQQGFNTKHTHVALGPKRERGGGLYLPPQSQVTQGGRGGPYMPPRRRSTRCRVDSF